MQEISTCPQTGKTKNYEVVVALFSDLVRDHQPIVLKAIIVDAENEKKARNCALKKAEDWVEYDERIHPMLLVWSVHPL